MWKHIGTFGGGGGGVGEKVGRRPAADKGRGNKEFFGLLKKDMCTFGTIVWFGEDTYVYSGFIFIKVPSCCWQRVCVQNDLAECLL
jgi:hypothetical protein